MEGIGWKLSSTSSALDMNADTFFAAKSTALDHHILRMSTDAAECIAQQAAVAASALTTVTHHATTEMKDSLAATEAHLTTITEDKVA